MTEFSLGPTQNLPDNWAAISIGSFRQQKSQTFNPGSAKEAAYELYSVPSHATGKPEIVSPSEIGSNKQHVAPGDVLISKINPRLNRTWTVGEKGELTQIASTEWVVFPRSEVLDPSFLKRLLSDYRLRDFLAANGSGVGGSLTRIRPDLFDKIETPLPPLNEQRRIVEKIEAMFDEIDKGVESLHTARTTLGLYRQSLLKSAFEGRLTADWRAQNADKLEAPETLLARIQSERDTRYKTALDAWQDALTKWRASGEKGKKPAKPKRPTTFPVRLQNLRIELPDLPHGWTWAQLGLCSSGPEYGTAAKSGDTGAVPVIRMGNLQRGHIDWDNLAFSSDLDEIEKYSLKSGDVLFNRTNSPELVGKTSIYKGERPALFAGYLVRVNQIEEIAAGPYLTYFLNSPIASKHGKSVKTDGVNQSNINASKLQEYPFPYCSPAEQAEIVRILDEKLEAADALEAEIDAALTRADALRQSILKKAFSGQLVPQDPKDEPASVLLERIKAERAKAPKTKKRRSAHA